MTMKIASIHAICGQITRCLLPVTAMVGLTLATSGAQAKSYSIGMVTPPGHIWSQISDRMSNNLKLASHDQIRLRSSRMAKMQGEAETIKKLQSGKLHLAILTAGSLSSLEPAFSGWYLPYLFKDVQAVAKATAGTDAQQMLQRLESSQLVGMGYALAGMRPGVSTRPVANVSDFNGMKIRSFPDQVFKDWWQTLNAVPMQLALLDTQPALLNKQLDAVDVDLDMLVGLKIYRDAPYLTVTNHMAFPGVVVASKVWWDGLTVDRQQMVMTAFKEAEAWGFQRQEEAEINNLALLKREGVKVANLGAEQMSAAISTVIKRYTAANPVIKHFYEQYHPR